MPMSTAAMNPGDPLRGRAFRSNLRCAPITAAIPVASAPSGRCALRLPQRASHDCPRLRPHRRPLKRRSGSPSPGSPATFAPSSMPPLGALSDAGGGSVGTPHASPMPYIPSARLACFPMLFNDLERPSVDGPSGWSGAYGRKPPYSAGSGSVVCCTEYGAFKGRSYAYSDGIHESMCSSAVTGPRSG